MVSVGCRPHDGWRLDVFGPCEYRWGLSLPRLQSQVTIGLPAEMGCFKTQHCPFNLILSFNQAVVDGLANAFSSAGVAIV